MASRSRSFLPAVGLIALSAASLGSAAVEAGSEGAPRRHALSLLGEPRLAADFKNFDWVNPEAPKGGTLRLSTVGTFDNLNPVTTRGVAASGLSYVLDSLMENSPDEPSTQYCLVCEWVSHPDDFSSVTFKIRDGARFHDGKPITVDDIIFSMEAMKAANERMRLYYKNVLKGEKTGEGEVTFKFDVVGNRELPVIVGQLIVLAKHYWEGKGTDGEPRDVTKSSLETFVSSGPYRIKSVVSGQSIVYERAKDYWAADLPAMRGQNNLDEVAYTYFRDDTAAFEEFKLGKIDLWAESTAANWANRYGFDAVKDGRVRKEELPHKQVVGMQGFAFNMRKSQFQDPRVRQAFTLTFNFEAANKSRFYGSYIRSGSFFGNSELAANGLPEGRELEILKSVESEIPKEVFTAAYAPPASPSDADHRRNMGQAFKLLQAAGWTAKDGVLMNAEGKTLDAEFLLDNPAFEAVVLPYVADLKKLGVNASLRTVDPSQYQRRMHQFDFDLTVENFGQSHSPGNEQRYYWGSAAADMQGSNNTAGIKSPAVDKLIDGLIMAKDRTDLVAYTRALDRVLLWSHVVVPNWHFPYVRVASWNKFGRPEKLPSQSPLYLSTWWLDADKEKLLAAAKSQ